VLYLWLYSYKFMFTFQSVKKKIKENTFGRVLQCYFCPMITFYGPKWKLSCLRCFLFIIVISNDVTHSVSDYCFKPLCSVYCKEQTYWGFWPLWMICWMHTQFTHFTTHFLQMTFSVKLIHVSEIIFQNMNKNLQHLSQLETSSNVNKLLFIFHWEL